MTNKAIALLKELGYNFSKFYGTWVIEDEFEKKIIFETNNGTTRFFEHVHVDDFAKFLQWAKEKWNLEYDNYDNIYHNYDENIVMIVLK